MGNSEHNLSALFSQLGLGSSDQDIQQFLVCHRVSRGEKVSDAGFWSENQSRFLKEVAKDDDEWAEVIDQLEAMLKR